jgi:hypothetical protein
MAAISAWKSSGNFYLPQNADAPSGVKHGAVQPPRLPCVRVFDFVEQLTMHPDCAFNAANSR